MTPAEALDKLWPRLRTGLPAKYTPEYLDAFLAMAARPPAVVLDEDDRLAALAKRAIGMTEHLWFLTDTPQRYDLGQELLGRAGAARTFISIDPASVAPTEIRYYRDPLRRLLGMHESGLEHMTGFNYQSPYGAI